MGQPHLTILAAEEFIAMPLPPREHVLDPILPVKGVAMLYAQRGVGKTRRTRHRAGRLARLSLNLALPEHQATVDGLLGAAEFLVLDNRSTLVSGGRENEAESWGSMQSWFLHLRRKGVTVLLCEHAGRGENARGTSKREDVLDTIIHLKRPDDYQMEEGARFEVHLTKARGVFGEDAAPFEARMEVRDGLVAWTTRELKDVEADRVAELTRAGESVRDIAAELGLTKSKVNRIQKRLKTDGTL